MRKLIFALTFSFLTQCFIAQEKEFPQDIDKKNELKVNGLTLIVLKWIDVSYERLINEESSYGIAVALNTDTYENNLNYSFTPFYRRYFSEKFARGFFVEGFGMLFSAKEFYFFNDPQNFETNFALGISVGGKFVSKSGFSTELLLGVGRTFNNNASYESIGRIGISVGYRF
jgi:hypothetical protein